MTMCVSSRFSRIVANVAAPSDSKESFSQVDVQALCLHWILVQKRLHNWRSYTNYRQASIKDHLTSCILVQSWQGILLPRHTDRQTNYNLDGTDPRAGQWKIDIYVNYYLGHVTLATLYKFRLPLPWE
jgi:hypothetical protein